MKPLTGKKILMIMPSLPYPETGAEQSDRANGIRQMKRLGLDVRVLAKVTEQHSNKVIEEARKEFAIPIHLVSYKYSNRKMTPKMRRDKWTKKLLNPRYLDGAALEYADPEMQKALKDILSEWRPDFVWFEYTYLWPLFKIVKRMNIPIVTRSINFEPIHFLQEDGYSLINLLKSLPKFESEKIICKRSDAILAITPKEEKRYKKLARGKVAALPLRGLHKFLSFEPVIREADNLNVFFMGSTYNVSHNRRVLEFILNEIIPLVDKASPNKFRFHIFGAKVPQDVKGKAPAGVIFKGYAEDLDSELHEMDIALAPSLAGAGMQQKIFEPLARGIPTITSERGLAVYPFVPDKDVLTAHSPQEFTEALLRLADVELRRTLSQNAKKRSRRLFSVDVIDALVRETLVSMR